MTRFWYLLFLGATAGLLVVDHVYMAMPVLLALAGFFYRGQAITSAPVTDPALQRSWTWLIGGFLALALSGLFLNLVHVERGAGAYERLLPFLLLPAMAWTIRAGRWRPEPWLLAVGLACLLALAAALIDIFHLMLPRAKGATSNPISFGHIAVVLGTICAIAAVSFPFTAHRNLYRAFLITSALAAAAASLFSGSKGGWLSLMIVAFAAAVLSARNLPPMFRRMAPFAAIAVILGLAFAAPGQLVRDRVTSGVSGALHWFQTGEVQELSVSVRFELWAMGWHIFSESPLVGQGAEGRKVRWGELAASGDFYKDIGDFSAIDNELVGVLAEGGLIGAFGYYLAYLGTLLAFLRFLRHPDAQVRCFAMIGALMVPIHLLFGLSVSVFGISMFRAVFVTLTVSLLAFITIRLAALARDSASSGYDAASAPNESGTADAIKTA